MSTYDTAALWSATQFATDQAKIGAAGLSVRQRKLLTLLSEPTSVAQLAQSIALPVEDVHVALDRFAKLGLAKAAAATPEPFDPMQLRATPVANAASVAASSRTPMLIGIALAALAVVAAAAWMLRGDPSRTTPLQPSIAKAPAQAAPAAQPAPIAAGSAAVPAAATATAPASPQVSQESSPPPAPVNTATARAAAAQATTLAAKATAAPAAAVRATPTTAAATTAAAAPTATGNTVAATAQASATAPAMAVSAPVAAAPVVAAPAPTPVVAPATVAAAAPAAAAMPAPARAAPAAAREIKLVTRVEPTFPRGFDTDSGTVRARLQVDARGAVTGVDIIEASPPRVFDRNVRTALQQWRYEPTGESFSTLAEIKFSR